MGVVVTGVVQLDKHLLELAQACGKAEPMLKRAANYVHSQVPPYPPAPATSTYRRTGTLGRTLSAAPVMLGASAISVVGSDLVYAPFVIDRGRQAWMHRGRWWTLQDVAAKAAPQAAEVMASYLRQFIH